MVKKVLVEYVHVFTYTQYRSANIFIEILLDSPFDFSEDSNDVITDRPVIKIRERCKISENDHGVQENGKHKYLHFLKLTYCQYFPDSSVFFILNIFHYNKTFQ